MKKNAFTLIELLASIVLLAILIAIGISSYGRYLTVTRNKSFTIAEKSFKSAAEEAYVDCATNVSTRDFCQNHESLTGRYGKSDTVYLKELVENSYIEKISNPYQDPKFCDIDRSYVIVKNNSTLGSSDNNDKIEYKICLICGNKKSEGCN